MSHFVGIKCETCSKLANCNDPIDDLPIGWVALVQRFQFYVLFRRKHLHFCSMECLYSWTDKQREQAEQEKRGIVEVK